jgi:1,6-anhydro-N-acetylmuramate kinase
LVGTELIAGCMTGTSLDGLDAALVRVSGVGLGIRAEVMRTISRPLGRLARPLRRLAEQHPLTAREIAQLGRDFALLHVRVLRELAGRERPGLVAVHGQTVFHAPPVSWQLMNPAPIVEALGVPVVYDLRAADLARGGEGAPITPLADFVFFRSDVRARMVVNLGGFCNVTLLPRMDDFDEEADAIEHIRGCDVCACNQVLDAVARRRLRVPWDRGGARALKGRVDRKAFAALLDLLSRQTGAGRSLGTGDELACWIGRYGHRVAPADMARTACAAVGEAIARQARRCRAQELVLAGGGVKNAALVAEIRERAGVPAMDSDELGVPASHREAAAMAVLGALCERFVPITLPQVTGVRRAPLAGCWAWPGPAMAD